VQHIDVVVNAEDSPQSALPHVVSVPRTAPEWPRSAVVQLLHHAPAHVMSGIYAGSREQRDGHPGKPPRSPGKNTQGRDQTDCKARALHLTSQESGIYEESEQ